MLRSFILLNRHKSLYLKRKLHYERNYLIIKILALSSPIIICFILLINDSGEKFLEENSKLIFPFLLIIDFSLRFFLKENLSVKIMPYLCLPIKQKVLLLYIVLSELKKVGLWVCLFIYISILYKNDTLTIYNSFPFIFLLFANNYLVLLIYTITKRFAILIYPFALVILLFILLLVSLSDFIFMFIISFSTMVGLITLLYFALKQKMHDELNSLSL